MSLRLVDLIALSHADGEDKIDLNSREVLQDPSSRLVLVEEGFVLSDGKLTNAGKETLKAVRKKEEDLRKGIPFHGTGSRNMKRLFKENTEPWFFILFGKDEIVTNGELLFVGKPETAMNATRGSEELKSITSSVIRQCGGGKFVQIYPHSYQAFSLGGIDLVWLANEDQSMMVPILAKYFDFVFGRFPKSSLWGKDKTTPIQARVRGKGTKNSVVAIVATFDMANKMKVPNKIEGWRKDDSKKMPTEGVPTMGTGRGSSVRKGEEE